jgi:hypothetical protein
MKNLFINLFMQKKKILFSSPMLMQSEVLCLNVKCLLVSHLTEEELTSVLLTI